MATQQWTDDEWAEWLQSTAASAPWAESVLADWERSLDRFPWVPIIDTAESAPTPKARGKQTSELKGDKWPKIPSRINTTTFVPTHKDWLLRRLQEAETDYKRASVWYPVSRMSDETFLEVAATLGWRYAQLYNMDVFHKIVTGGGGMMSRSTSTA